jgi:peptide/nickel transport system substrate-binding protein
MYDEGGSHQLSRRNLLHGAGLLGLGLLAGPSLTACAGEPSATRAGAPAVTGPPRRGGEFVYAWPYQPGNVLSPGMPPGYTGGDLWVQLQMFDQLTVLNPGRRDVEPGLASEWEVVDNGSRWIFTLRDAEFSNGMPVTAEDVKFSLERFADPQRNLYAFWGQIIQSVQIKGPRVVEVRLKQPRGGLADLLSIAPASILPAKVVKELGEKGFEAKPVGSGAFRFDSRERGRTLRLVRNDNYWRSGQPYLDSVRFEFVADAGARILRVTEGDAHAAGAVPFSQLARLEKSSGAHVQVDEIASIAMVQLSPRLKPLADPKVRRALNLAIPREAMKSSVFNGKVEIANSHLQKLRFWDQSVAPYPLDPDQAKRLMAESTAASGFEMELTYVGSDSEARTIATVLADAWAPLGVRVRQAQVDVGTLNQRRSAGTYDGMIAFDMLSDTPSEDQFAEGFYAPPQPPGGAIVYDSKEARTLVDKGLRAVGDDARRTAWTELQRYGMGVDGPNIPLFFLNERTLVRDNVGQFKPTVLATMRFEQVWLAGS